jgi:hypothetical protein
VLGSKHKCVELNLHSPCSFVMWCLIKHKEKFAYACKNRTIFNTLCLQGNVNVKVRLIPSVNTTPWKRMECWGIVEFSSGLFIYLWLNYYYACNNVTNNIISIDKPTQRNIERPGYEIQPTCPQRKSVGILTHSLTFDINCSIAVWSQVSTTVYTVRWYWRAPLSFDGVFDLDAVDRQMQTY